MLSPRHPAGAMADEHVSQGFRRQARNPLVPDALPGTTPRKKQIPGIKPTTQTEQQSAVAIPR